LCGSAVLALLVPSTNAWAQSGNPPPPSPAPAPAPAPSPPAAATEPPPQPGQDDIVVTAPTQQTSIDRQTYIVRDTAEARSASAPDILARIPSIEVQQDGSVRLIGAGTANVLIDGRRVSDPNTILRTLQGSQIERVEVMTNPGAQFPAQGTGGIVNIITRRSSQNGLGGSATASGGSYGSYDLRLSPTYGSGNWTFTGNLGTGEGERHARYARERFTLTPGGPVLDSSEAGRERQHYHYYYGAGTASWRPTDHRTFTLSGTVAHTDFSLGRDSDLVDAAIAGGGAAQSSTTRSHFDYRDLGLDYRGTTARAGEALTGSVKYTRFGADSVNLFATDPLAGPDRLFRQDGSFSEDNWTLKADYVRPFGGPRRLSFGAQLITNSNRQTQSASGTLPSGPFAASSLVDGSWIEYAGYVTYQFGVAGFTVLPGLRVERREYDLGGTTGQPDLRTTHVFPSFHMERTLAQWLQSDFSYSRRVTYPVIPQLDPALVFADATTAQGGNPLLRPQFTDSYEFKLHAQVVHHNFDLTLFRRSTDDVLSQRGELDANGVLVVRPLNFGSQVLTGGELAARGPLLPGLRYVLTANVADNGLDQDGNGPLRMRHGITWGGTAQLEYKDGQDGRRGSDRVNLNIRYFGPNDTGFSRTSTIAVGGVTWTHGITDRLQSVATVQQVLLVDGWETVTTGATSLSREFRHPAWGRVSFALTWSFRPPGQGPQVRQQQGGAPPIPGAGGPG
jgi:outer membrane receptor protein involved in Fe transport